MQYDNEKKEPVVAWLLWFFLGIFGVHRFYLGQKTDGAYILGGWFVLYLFLPFLFAVGGVPSLAIFTWGAVAVWWIVEAVLLSGNIQKVNNWKRVQVFQRNGLQAPSY